MIILWLILFIIYIVIVQIISFCFVKFKKNFDSAGILKGAVAGYSITLLFIIAGILVFESDEKYWYYGPSWRFDLLFLLILIPSLISMIGGPISGRYFHQRRIKKEKKNS